MLSGRSKDECEELYISIKGNRRRFVWRYKRSAPQVKSCAGWYQTAQDTSGEGTTSLLRNILMFKATKR